MKLRHAVVESGGPLPTRPGRERRLLALLGLLLWALATGVQAQDFTYTTNAGAITITGYTGPGGSSYFSDPQWTNHPARFYRLRSP